MSRSDGTNPADINKTALVAYPELRRLTGPMNGTEQPTHHPPTTHNKPNARNRSSQSSTRFAIDGDVHMVVVIIFLSAAAYVSIATAILIVLTPNDRETTLSVWDIKAREQRDKASETTTQFPTPVEMRRMPFEWSPRQRPYNIRPYVKGRWSDDVIGREVQNARSAAELGTDAGFLPAYVWRGQIGRAHV